MRQAVLTVLGFSKSCAESIAKQVIELDPLLNLLQIYEAALSALFSTYGEAATC